MLLGHNGAGKTRPIDALRPDRPPRAARPSSAFSREDAEHPVDDRRLPAAQRPVRRPHLLGAPHALPHRCPRSRRRAMCEELQGTSRSRRDPHAHADALGRAEAQAWHRALRGLPGPVPRRADERDGRPRSSRRGTCCRRPRRARHHPDDALDGGGGRAGRPHRHHGQRKVVSAAPSSSSSSSTTAAAVRGERRLVPDAGSKAPSSLRCRAARRARGAELPAPARRGLSRACSTRSAGSRTGAGSWTASTSR